MQILARQLGGSQTERINLGIGLVTGLLVALGKQSRFWLLRKFCGIYIWLFRSLPLLVLLIFIFNLPQIFPFTSAVLSNPFMAGLLALILSETAYIAEIHRGGLLSVGVGQKRRERRWACELVRSS